MLFPSPRGAAVQLLSSCRTSPPSQYLLFFSISTAATSLSFFFSLLNNSSSMESSSSTLQSPSPLPKPKQQELFFSSPESLSNWLSSRLPAGSLSLWGSLPGSKPLHNLWLELNCGESSILDAEQLIRTVHVTTIKIRNSHGARLIESGQLLSNGAIRSRDRPLSEKMKPGESVDEAVTRAVAEELGPDVEVQVIPGTYSVRVEDRRSSASYPGLSARYVLHAVEARVVRGVPDEGEFETEETGEVMEAGEKDAVVVKRHFWRWVNDDDHDNVKDGEGNASALSDRP